MGTLYTDLLYRIENVHFSIKKILLSSGWVPNTELIIINIKLKRWSYYQKYIKNVVQCQI